MSHPIVLRITIPIKFWEHHKAWLEFDGNEDLCRVVVTLDYAVTLNGTPAQIAALQEHAEFYGDGNVYHDSETVRAATATLQAIKTAQEIAA